MGADGHFERSSRVSGRPRPGGGTPMQSKGFLGSFLFSWVGVGPEIADFEPLPCPTWPRGDLGKAPTGALVDLHRSSAR